MDRILTAKDIMSTRVEIVAPETSLRAAWQILSTSQISGAPVVSSSGTLVGVVSQVDLARRAFRDTFDPHHAASFYQSLSWSEEGGSALEDSLAQLGSIKVEEVMNPYVITVPIEAAIPEIASAMRSHRIHRVLVAKNAKLFGIITALDMLKLLERPESRD
jgi:CBS domain-containing protein